MGRHRTRLRVDGTAQKIDLASQARPLGTRTRMLLAVRAAVRGVGAHGRAQLSDRVRFARGLGGQWVASLGRTRAQLSSDAGTFLRAAQGRTARDRHVSDDGDTAAHILRSQRPPGGVLGNDGDLDAARGGRRLRADDAQACLTPADQGEHISRAYARKHPTRLVARLALTGARTRLFSLADAITQHEVLADIARGTGQVIGDRVLPCLEFGQTRGQLHNGRVSLELCERGLQDLSGLRAR